MKCRNTGRPVSKVAPVKRELELTSGFKIAPAGFIISSSFPVFYCQTQTLTRADTHFAEMTLFDCV